MIFPKCSRISSCRDLTSSCAVSHAVESCSQFDEALELLLFFIFLINFDISSFCFLSKVYNPFVDDALPNTSGAPISAFNVYPCCLRPLIASRILETSSFSASTGCFPNLALLEINSKVALVAPFVYSFNEISTSPVAVKLYDEFIIPYFSLHLMELMSAP